MNFVPKRSIHPAYRDFQRQLDEAFDKSNPDKSVPWPKAPAPRWAEQFRPRTIVDIGCATGRFTSAILDRLGAWGCLADIERLVLVEEEPGFDSTDPGAIADTIARCRDVIGRYTDRNPEVSAANAAATIEQKTGTADRTAIVVANADLPIADLLIASHVSYYFPDAGRSFLGALSSNLTSGGMAWMVVRKHDCPLYRERSSVLLKSNRLTAGEGYAEDIDAAIRDARDIELREKCDLGYLKFDDKPSDCVPLAHLLMWRDILDPNIPDSRSQAAERACNTTEPLFSESHFIIGKPRRPDV